MHNGASTSSNPAPGPPHHTLHHLRGHPGGGMSRPYGHPSSHSPSGTSTCKTTQSSSSPSSTYTTAHQSTETTTTTSSLSSSGKNPAACSRPGCNNPVQRNREGWNEYCSSACVVGQCRDVYTNWSGSTSNALASGEGEGQRFQTLR